jgi:hypothetical protein
MPNIQDRFGKQRRTDLLDAVNYLRGKSKSIRANSLPQVQIKE